MNEKKNQTELISYQITLQNEKIKAPQMAGKWWEGLCLLDCLDIHMLEHVLKL